MLQRQIIDIKSSGEHVLARFGNVETKIQYEDALLISHWLVWRAKEAKRFAGDRSRLVKTIGTIHDASRGDGPADIRSRGVPISKKSSWAISTEGYLVVAKFGSHTLKLNYHDASTLAQFIRVRAKEAKRRAGDVLRHWSEICLDHDDQYGPGVTRG